MGPGPPPHCLLPIWAGLPDSQPSLTSPRCGLLLPFTLLPPGQITAQSCPNPRNLWLHQAPWQRGIRLQLVKCHFILFIYFLKLFIYLFIYGCVGSSFLCEGFLQLRQGGATLHRGARASRYRGLSCCGAQLPDAQAQ